MAEEFFSRSISSNLCESETLDQLTDEEERIFFRLLSQTDQAGRYKGNPEILSSYLFPISRKKSSEQIRAALTRLVSCQAIWWYTVDGKQYIEFQNFGKFQKFRPDVKLTVLYPGHEQGTPVIVDSTAPPRTDPDGPGRTRTDPDGCDRNRADLDIDIDAEETTSSESGSDAKGIPAPTQKTKPVPVEAEVDIPEIMQGINAVYFLEYGKTMSGEDVSVVRDLLKRHYPATIEAELRKVKRRRPKAVFAYINASLGKWSSRNGPPSRASPPPVDEDLSDEQIEKLNAEWGTLQ